MARLAAPVPALGRRCAEVVLVPAGDLADDDKSIDDVRMDESPVVMLSEIASAVRGAGLIVRGGFHPQRDDEVPDLVRGTPAATLVMVGNAGPAMWSAFVQSGLSKPGPDPLDAWTERVVAAAAEPLGARPLFPFTGPPYLPFQRWAQRADEVSRSPIGLLIHPQFGLWHAYRAALIFAERLEIPPYPSGLRPCDGCREKPCLSTCPVGAFRRERYDVPGCLTHLAVPAGRDCVGLGCRARRACPIGTAYRYEPAQAEFHMRAFVRARRG